MCVMNPQISPPKKPTGTAIVLNAPTLGLDVAFKMAVK